MSGNPAGRPRSGESLAEYVRKLGGPDGRVYIDRLHELALGQHQDEQLRLRALSVLLDRGYGKPVEALDVQADVGTMVAAERLANVLSTEELTFLEGIQAKLTAADD